jgi:hypothetical protein
VHLGSAHSRARPARPSGPAPLGVSAHGQRNRGEFLLVVGGSPAKSGWPAAIGRRGSCLGANPSDGDPYLGRGAVRGSLELGCDGDGDRAEGCAGEGVGRLSLTRLVRTVSTSELRGRYWQGQRGRRSTRGGGRRWPVMS